MMKRFLFSAAGSLIAITGLANVVSAETSATAADHRSVGSTLEVHIFHDGKVLVRGAKVTNIASSTISATTSWGAYVMTWTVQTDGTTELVRRFGGSSSLAEIAVGDFISFHGMLVTSAAQPTVLAKTIKDWSVQRIHASFFGSVVSIDSAARSFVLNSEGRANQTVFVSDTTKFMKGNASTTSFADVKVGGKIHASGVWNNLQNTLAAEKVKIYVDPITRQTTFEGRLKSSAGTSAPTTLVISMGSKDYTVHIASDTSILNERWAKASLADFKVGDKVRMYGAAEGSDIEATVIRNTSLR